MKGEIATHRLPAVSAALVALAALLSASPAAAQFGKNKVQYDDFHFKVLQTEHFDIYYYPEEEAAIYDAARMAERGYARLSKVFRHDWDERKPLIVYASQSDFQQTNIFSFQLDEGTAGITEGLRDRIVVFFPSAYPEFDHTLTHELVHAFQYDILRRGALSQGNNPFAFRAPLWFMEGMAEYLSTGQIDPQTAMWLRDASLSGYLTTIRQLSQVQDIRVYRFGQAFWYYIGTKYGDEKIGEIMQKAPLIGVEAAFKQSLNRSLDDLSKDWLEAIRLTYMPQVVQYPEADEVGVKLTDHVQEGGSVNVGPALSPDGKRVAFVSDRDIFNDLWIADSKDGGHADKLVKGERSASFESLRFLRVGMAFSPDGRFLAFSSKVGEEDALYIMRVKDEKIVDSYRFGLEGIETPSWSPDGRQIVFTGLEGGVSDLYVVNRDGTDLRRLTDDRYAQRDPVWSPDGGRIAFTTDFGPGTDFDLLAYGDYQIGIMDLESREITFLPGQAGKNINPQWGPDGRSIAYLSDRDGITNVYLYDFDQAETYQLTDMLTGATGIIDSSPALSWSRDGGTMVFSAFSDAGWDLYRVDHPRKLAVTPWTPGEKREYDLAARAFVRPAEPANESAAVAVDSLGTASRQPGNDGDRDHAEPGAGGKPDEGKPGDGGQPGDVAAAPPQPDAVSYYLGESKPRGRRAPPRAGVNRLPSFDQPVDVATLLRDPTIGLPRDTTRFQVRPYQVHFQPDLISQPEVGFASGVGAFGASQLAFSDLLGDHNLYFAASVFGSIKDSDLFFTYANLKKRWNWGASVFQFRSDFSPLAVGPVGGLFLFRSDIYRGTQFFTAYPFSRFRRIELGAQATYVDRRIARFDIFDPTPNVEQDLPNETFLSPSAAYVYDTAFYGSTGPVGGTRQRFEVQRGFGDRTFTQFYGDLRRYFFFDRRYTLATRFLFLGVYGQDQDNLRVQTIGGPTLLRGYDYNDPDHPELIGTEVGLWNFEFRFPVVERPLVGGAAFPPIRGALWYDLGYARIEDRPFQFATTRNAGPLGFRLADARASFGVGLRMNLFGFSVLRFDVAVPTDMASLDRRRFLFTLAPEF